MENSPKLSSEVQGSVLHVLKVFVPEMVPAEMAPFLIADEPGYWKFIVGVIGNNGRCAIVKLVHEDDDLASEKDKIERQNMFSELLREKRDPYAERICGGRTLSCPD